jgi:hypothetical protein
LEILQEVKTVSEQVSGTPGWKLKEQENPNFALISAHLVLQKDEPSNQEKSSAFLQVKFNIGRCYCHLKHVSTKLPAITLFC